MESKKNYSYAIVAICILAFAVIFTLLDALIPLKVWTHPALNFLFINCLGFGITAIVFASEKKSVWFFFVGALLIGLALYYIFFQYAPWWVGLIVVVAAWAVFAIISVMMLGNMTESISLNKSPDYKTFEQRKAEEKEKAAAEEKPEKPLPEIKSFK